MKRFQRLIIHVLFLALPSIILAQSNQQFRNTGFGGPVYQGSSLAGEWASGGGGYGGRYLSKNFYLGGGGFGLENRTEGYNNSLAYGGILLGYEWIGEEEKNSLNFQFMAGYGSAERANEFEKETDGLWVIKPEVRVEFPLASWARLGIGGGFRWIFNSDIASLGSKELSAPFASLNLRFGDFSN